MPRTVPALLVLLFCPAAHAQFSLQWEAPIECPTRDSVHEEATRLLGGTLPEPLDLSVRGVATRGEDDWTLTLRTMMDGVEGERVVEGDRCEELAAAASLILALMIDPGAVATAPATGPEREPTLEPTPEPTLEPTPEPTPAPASIAHDLGPPGIDDTEPHVTPAAAPDEPPDDGAPEEDPDALRGFIGAGGLLDVGSVPDVSGGIVLEGGIGVPLIDVIFRLRASFVFGQTAFRPDTESGAEITAGTIDARACVYPFEGARLIYGCAGFFLGVAVAEGIGFDRNEVGVGTYAGAVASLGLAWRLEPWLDVELDASLIVPFNPLEFAVRATPDLVFHTMEPVAGRFGLTTHVHF